jgi:GTP-binding protein HflX
VIIPYNRGDLVAQFHQFGTIESEEYEEGGTHLKGYMPSNHSGPFNAFQPGRPKRSKRLTPTAPMNDDTARSQIINLSNLYKR